MYYTWLFINVTRFTKRFCAESRLTFSDYHFTYVLHLASCKYHVIYKVDFPVVDNSRYR